MFAANAGLLAQHGLIYPRLNRFTGHHGLVLNWDGMPKHYRMPDGACTALQQIAAQYGDSDQTVFLSSEEFSRSASLTGLGRLREALAGFDRIEVVCTLRTQWQFLQSVYLEISKSRLPQRPPGLVSPVIDSGMFEGLWVDYNHILDALEQCFDPAEITLFDFRTCLAAEGGVPGHMLRHLGLPLGAGALQVVNDGASNVSPLSLASWAANILSDPDVAPPWLIAKATEAMWLEFGQDVKPCLFTRAEFRLLKEHFDARNQVLQRRRAPYQPGFTLPPASAEHLTLFRNEISGPYWLRVSRRLVRDML